MELREIHKSVLAECAHDDVGLWSVIVRVYGQSYARHSILPDAVRRETISIVNDLLSEGLIEAGNPNGLEFMRFSWSVSGIIDYIENEWNRLARTPDVGEVCWFRATPNGKKLANELGLEGY